MNYADLNKTIEKKVLAAIALINNPEIAPEIRQLNQEILLREVGSAVYNKVYDMNAYDFEIQHTKGPGIDDRYYGLAKVVSSSVSTGKTGTDEYVKNYLNNVSGKAQQDSFKNAKESGTYPRVKRVADSNACKWCRSKAGEYTDPPSDVFHRHGGCECQITTEGYKSRNGQLNNYKPTVRAATTADTVQFTDEQLRAAANSNKPIGQILQGKNTNQRDFEKAINAGNIPEARRILAEIPDADPYKKSYASIIEDTLKNLKK